ncbi:MAG: metallophosphoesterase [Parafilimonas sp.]
MKQPPIITTRDRGLSLWETFGESLQRFIHKDMSTAKVRQLPFMQAIYAHVEETQGKKLAGLQPNAALLVEKSKAFYALAQTTSIATNNATTLAKTDDIEENKLAARDYSDDDLEWWVLAGTWWEYMTMQQIEHAPAYQEVAEFLFSVSPGGAAALASQWFLQSSDEKIQDIIEYRKWHDQGAGKNFSKIAWTLPNDAKVIMLGDWGTSNDDCKQLLKAIWLQEENPAAFVHLGDIYYSGSKEECDNNFYNIFRDVAKELGKQMVPVFTIPGNHEYYSMGKGFYHLIDKMNASSNQRQGGSYFCLRTADSKWQFLAMDTGQDDNNPYVTHLSPFAPQLFGDRDSDGELAWHKDKLDNFSGQTIMMSHHQLFTRDSENMIDSDVEPFFNRYLHGYFSRYFNKIAAWYWGHEHSFAIYQDGIFGLAKGRLLGSSSYEVPQTESSSNRYYPIVPYARNNVQPPVDNDGFFYHACAVFDFKRTNPSDPINVKYYSFPSWAQYESMPSNAALALMLSEEISASPMRSFSWTGNDKMDNDIVSNNTPSLLQNGHHLFIAFNKAASGSNSNNELMMASYDQNNNDNNWSNPVAISSNGHTVFTAHGPSLTVHNGTYYLIYADSSNSNKVGFISSTDLKNWSSPRYVVSNNQTRSSGSAISSVWIGNTCYIAFQDTATKSITLISTDMGNVSTINVPNLPSGLGTPTLAASGSNLYLFYRKDDSNSSYIYWQIYNTSSGVWTNKKCVTNNGIEQSVGTPKATSSVAAIVEANGDITIFYGAHNVDNQKTVNWATYSIAHDVWSGGVSLPRMKKDNQPPFMQKSPAAIALPGGGAYVAFISRSDNSVRWASRT